jgi:hypothetical protein
VGVLPSWAPPAGFFQAQPTIILVQGCENTVREISAIRACAFSTAFKRILAITRANIAAGR